MVPIGYPGPIHSPALHLDMYTATALLSAIVGVINIVLLIVVFKEHTVPDEVLVPDIQGSGKILDITTTRLFSILRFFTAVETVILMALSLLYTYICYYPIATFQKAGTCLDAQQSMAKQPIKCCVSNQNRTCGKSVSEKSE